MGRSLYCCSYYRPSYICRNRSRVTSYIGESQLDMERPGFEHASVAAEAGPGWAVPQPPPASPIWGEEGPSECRKWSLIWDRRAGPAVKEERGPSFVVMEEQPLAFPPQAPRRGQGRDGGGRRPGTPAFGRGWVAGPVRSVGCSVVGSVGPGEAVSS